MRAGRNLHALTELSDPRIVFSFGKTERGLSIEEAGLLHDYLGTLRALSARSLRKRIGAEITAGEPSPILLDGKDIDALQQALCDAEVGTFGGLELLKSTVCGAGVDAGPIDDIDDLVVEPEL